eukprot:2322629-Amphidinium_carterae.1
MDDRNLSGRAMSLCPGCVHDATHVVHLTRSDRTHRVVTIDTLSIVTWAFDLPQFLPRVCEGLMTSKFAAYEWPSPSIV